jgi:stearoyl-CoA desaturase (delta-9 desaturase)
VNWFGHKIGYRNYELKNTSTNLYPFDFFFLGEAYHNDHHRFPSSPKMGVKWYEVDVAYYAIRLMDKLHIIKLQNRNAARQHELDVSLADSLL